MLGQMNIWRVLIFCCSDTGDNGKTMFIFSFFPAIMIFLMAHFRDGTSRIIRYVYGSFCERMGSCCSL